MESTEPSLLTQKRLKVLHKSWVREFSRCDYWKFTLPAITFFLMWARSLQLHPSAYTLVHGLAEARALHMSCTTGEPTTAGVFSQVLGSYRRILSCCSVWSQENCLLHRMGHRDEGAARQAAARRTEAVREEEWSRRETPPGLCERQS